MPEHQQIQQSTESKSTFQKQVTPIIQTPISNPMAIIQRARINPKSLTHADIMQLQRTIGNRAVGRLLSEIRSSSMTQKVPIQRQEIPDEEKTCPSCMQRQEIPEEEEPLQGKMIGTIQRQEIPEEEEPLQGKTIETIQRQEIPEEEESLQGEFENKPEIACSSCFTAPIVQRQEIPEEEEPVQEKMTGTIQRQEIPEEEETLQTKKGNNTGMPDNLKAGVESLSGIGMSDVRVHYNSSKPAEVGALAYTQGTNIHVAPGQERHLPHEAWHAVQQKQGRVKPTMQTKDGVPVNDDKGLEHEADVMGGKGFQQYAQVEKPKESKSRSIANSMTQKRVSNHQCFGFVDVPPEAIAQRNLQEVANSSLQVTKLRVIQNRPKNNSQASSLVVQRIQFNPGQDRQVMNWIITNNLHGRAPFNGLYQRYQQNNRLDNNDAEAITMLFLTMVPAYRDFAQRNVAIDYLYNQYYSFYPNIGLIDTVNPPASVAEFTNKYKIFYHLYSRALLAGQNGIQAVYTVHSGMKGLSQDLGNQAQGPVVILGQVANTDDERIQKIYTAARNKNLRFNSQSSAVSHLVKHGAMYNSYNKITGQEGAQALGPMIDQYVQDANYVVGEGNEQIARRDVTLGRYVYTFTTEFETVMISCAADGSNAFIATYYWREPPAYVDDLVAGNGQNPNI